MLSKQFANFIDLIANKNKIKYVLKKMIVTNFYNVLKNKLKKKLNNVYKNYPTFAR